MNPPARSLQLRISSWYTRHKNLFWRVTLWVAVAIIIRLIFIGSFYKDNQTVMVWLSAGLFVQTIVVYYFFGYFVFPRYVYRLSILASLSWLGFWHALLYESNYLLFWVLQQLSDGPRLKRDWNLFYDAGLLGWVTDASAAFYSFFYSFPLALIFLMYLAVRDILSYRTRNLQLEKEKLILELDFLRSQINPHSLFNVLNSVYADVFETNQKAADLVLRLSELMRYNLYEADVPRIALDKELAYIQNYLDLERNRLNGQNVSIDYAQTGNLEHYQIAPLLLITFVENAFKHGAKGAKSAACVEVFASVEDGQLTFQVENNVAPKRQLPVDESVTPPKSGGVGLGNVRRRLDALYKDQYELILTPAKDRYTVVLTIQLELVGKD